MTEPVLNKTQAKAFSISSYRYWVVPCDSPDCWAARLDGYGWDSAVFAKEIQHIHELMRREVSSRFLGQWGKFVDLGDGQCDWAPLEGKRQLREFFTKRVAGSPFYATLALSCVVGRSWMVNLYFEPSQSTDIDTTQMTLERQRVMAANLGDAPGPPFLLAEEWLGRAAQHLLNLSR